MHACIQASIHACIQASIHAMNEITQLSVQILCVLLQDRHNKLLLHACMHTITVNIKYREQTIYNYIVFIPIIL